MKGIKASILNIGICIVFLTVALLFNFACAPKGPSGAKTLNIGALNALTGFGSDSEKLVWEGAQIVEEYFNKAGGIKIKGDKYLVKMTAADSQGSAEGTIAAVRKLVFDDNIKIVVGQSVPFQMAAANTITEPNKILHGVMYNTMTPQEFGPDFKYTFLVGGGGAVDATSGLFGYTAKNNPGGKNITVLIPDDGQIPYMEPVIKRIAQKEGFTVIDVVGWAMDTVDFYPVAQKAMAKKPDMIAMTTGWPMFIGAILKGVREMGFTGLVLGTNPAEDILTIAGPQASTNYIGIGILPDDPNLPPICHELGGMIKQKFGHLLFYNLWGSNAYYTIVKAAEAAQSVDPTDIKNYLEKADTIDSLYGPSKLGGLETYGIKHDVLMPVPIQTLMNGQPKWVAWQPIDIP